MTHTRTTKNLTRLGITIATLFILISVPFFVYNGSASSEGATEALWSFEGNSNKNVVDSSGNGNDGRIRGAEKVENGISGKAIYFDGKNDDIRVKDDDSLDITDELTLAAWVKPTSEYRFPVLLKEKAYFMVLNPVWKTGGFRLMGGVYAGGRLNVVMMRNNDEPVKEDQWSHIAMSYDGSALKIFVNGKEMASRPFNKDIDASNKPLWLGKAPMGRNWHFTGYVDEVGVYSEAFSAQEIKTLAEGSQESSVLHVGKRQTYATINDALDDANHGDTIMIHKGTYTENVEITKKVTISTVRKGITLKSYIYVKGIGDLEIKDAKIKFAPTKNYQYGIRAYLDTNLTIVDSTLTWAKKTPWGGIYAYDNSTLIIKNSHIAHGRSVYFKSDFVILEESNFTNLATTVYGETPEGRTPKIKNIVSENNKWGLYHKGKGHWKITGDNNRIKNNQKDIVIGSCGNVEIPSLAFVSTYVRPSATGNVVEL